MKKILTLTALFMVSMSFILVPSDCDILIFFKEGTKTTMTSYNPDGKVIGSAKSIYKKVEKSGATSSVSVTQEDFDKKGKLTTTRDFTIKCANGTLSFDMKAMLPQQQAETMKEFDVTVEGINKELPSDLSVGASLKDAEVKFIIKTKNGDAMPMLNTSVFITNRKVEAKENITTPAGTFECYKLTEDVEMKTLFKIRMKSVSWFSKETGVVKIESYKDSGKLIMKQELTEITK